MLSTLWNTLLITPILNLLIALFHFSGGLGFAIILLTLIVRTLLVPIVLPSIKSMKKQRELQPEIDKLKRKYKNDKQKQAQMQMELFKKHGLNPASGCLMQLPMFIVLIALYGVIIKFSNNIDVAAINAQLYFESLKFAQGATISTAFGYLDLAKPDPYFLLGGLAGAFQFVASKMMQPFAEAGTKAAKRTPDKTDDIAYNVQGQMLYMMPLLTVVISLKLPAGAVLYILTTTIFSVAQQYFVAGWGGLAPLLKKIGLKV